MPKKINIAPLKSESDSLITTDNQPTMIEVNHVSMVFNMASEQLNSLKEYVIALARRELRFKEFKALDEISFEVKKGDVFGILGTNGSGKSTLLKIIAGVLEPSEGTFSINGNIAPLIELGAGFDMELTARENIYLNGALLGYSKRFIEQNFDDIVSFAEIEEFLDMPLKNYSSGMVARIAFAIATVIVPEILIVDEVLSVGDFMFQQKCEERILKLINEHEVTVLIVSHNNDQIERLCNKAIWIEKGHTRMQGSAQEVCRAYRTLGGRLGSKVSEQRVFGILENTTSYPKNFINTITGEDSFGTAAKLLDQLAHPTRKPAIITSGESSAHCMLATSIARALNASLVISKSQTLPDTTRQALRHLNPKRIIALGDCTIISDQVLDEIKTFCDQEYPICRINAQDLPSLSLKTYEFGLDKTIPRGKTALITHRENISGLLAISPFLYLDSAPLFFTNESKEVDDNIFHRLLTEELQKIVTIDENTVFSAEQLLELDNNNVEVIQLSGDGAYRTNENINNWLINQTFIFGRVGLHQLLVVSSWNPVDAYTAGLFAGENSCVFLLDDPGDIDSVAHAIDYINEHADSIKELTFIGDTNRFNDLDKELLGKALAIGRS